MESRNTALGPDESQGLSISLVPAEMNANSSNPELGFQKTDKRASVPSCQAPPF